MLSRAANEEPHVHMDRPTERGGRRGQQARVDNRMQMQSLHLRSTSCCRNPRLTFCSEVCDVSFLNDGHLFSFARGGRFSSISGEAERIRRTGGIPVPLGCETAARGCAQRTRHSRSGTLWRDIAQGPRGVSTNATSSTAIFQCRSLLAGADDTTKISGVEHQSELCRSAHQPKRTALHRRHLESTCEASGRHRTPVSARSGCASSKR